MNDVDDGGDVHMTEEHVIPVGGHMILGGHIQDVIIDAFLHVENTRSGMT